MPVGRVRTETGVDPETQAVAKLLSDFRDCLLRRVVRKPAVLLVSRNGEQQEVCDAGGQVLLDHFQRRRKVVTQVAAQSGNRLWLVQALDYKERLNQLRASGFGLRAQVAQVWRRSQTHQTLHRDISFNRVSVPGAIATGSGSIFE